MANITECLEQIISARYGKDVRQAIHDGIKEIDGVARTAQDSATSASQTAMEKASQAVSASETAIQKAEEAQASSEQAKNYAENASAVTGVEIATKDRAGLVKGGDNYIAEDGTLTLAMETTKKTLQNSHAGGIKVEEIGGKSEQNQYAGHNLWSAGTDLTVAGYVNYSVELKAGTYTLSCVATSTDTDTDVCLVRDATNGISLGNLTRGTRSSITFTLTNDTQYIALYSGDGYGTSQGDTATFKDIMLSTETLPFEPYTGKKPSPSPEYPQEIKKVVLSGVSTGGGNNLLSYNSDLVPSPNLSISNDSKSNATIIELNGNTHVAISGDFSLLASSIARIGFANEYPVNGGTIEKYQYLSSNGVLNVTGYKYLLVCLSTYGIATTKEQVVKSFMANFGTEFLPYEPYQESSITFTNPITLNGIGDVKDRIVRKDGVWGVERRFDNERYSSDSIIEMPDFVYSNITYFCLTRPSNSKSFGENTRLILLSDKFCYKNVVSSFNDASNVGTINGNAIGHVYWLGFPKGTTLEEAQSFGDIEVTYELAEPTFEPLPTADQIALNSLISFDGTTYLYFDSEIEPTSLLEYGTSKMGALALEAWNKAENNRIRTEELATALQMINQG